MINHVKRSDIGHINHGWLNTYHHFSFASYYNEKRMNFGVLRVVNDDVIAGNTGFDMHPHKDMEIITYIIDGELTHEDSLNNKRTIKSKDVQYMSAGTGIWHSESNNSSSSLRLLQIWVIPDKKGHIPNYGDINLSEYDSIDKWLHFVSDQSGQGLIKVNQDVNFYITESEKEFEFKVNKGRQAYVINIENKTYINDLELNEGDALEVFEENLKFRPSTKSHIMIIEMKR